MEAILQEGINLKEAWCKINSILLQRQKSKIFNNYQISNKVIEGFSELYEAQQSRNFDHRQRIQNALSGIFDIIQLNNEFFKNIPSSDIPSSNANDFNGFKQKHIIQTIKADNRQKELRNYFRLLGSIIESENNKNLFLHNKTKVILFNKTEEVENWKQLRPIKIIPAWLITLEKLIKPLLDDIINPTISKYQHGLKPNSNINFAKMTILYNIKRNKKYSLLIDIEKAYDSVDRTILYEKIERKFECRGKIILYLLNIYSTLELEILGSTILQTKGLPQGSAISPSLFNIYIDELLENINNTTDSTLNSFADDMIDQNESNENLQKNFLNLIQELKLLGLKVNINKTEFLCDNENEFIVNEENNIIMSTPVVKYLGQYIDADGNIIKTIDNAFFSKILNILSNNKSLSRISRLKIFKTYMRGKFSHLIPLIAASKRYTRYLEKDQKDYL